MRRLVFVLAAASLSLLACKSPCRQLAEKLCECSQTTTARNSCQARFGQEEQRIQPTDEQQLNCARLLKADQCDCHTIDTFEGKVACGLAYPLDGGQ